MRRLRPPDGSARPGRRRRYELSALRRTPYRPADSSESVPASDQKHRSPNEGGAISVPLFATIDPTRSLDVVLALFAILFITIGVATQAAGVFRGLILVPRNICGKDRRNAAHR